MISFRCRTLGVCREPHRTWLSRCGTRRCPSILARSVRPGLAVPVLFTASQEGAQATKESRNARRVQGRVTLCTVRSQSCPSKKETSVQGPSSLSHENKGKRSQFHIQGKGRLGTGTDGLGTLAGI